MVRHMARAQRTHGAGCRVQSACRHKKGAAWEQVQWGAMGADWTQEVWGEGRGEKRTSALQERGDW